MGHQAVFICDGCECLECSDDISCDDSSMENNFIPSIGSKFPRYNALLCIAITRTKEVESLMEECVSIEILQNDEPNKLYHDANFTNPLENQRDDIFTMAGPRSTRLRVHPGYTMGPSKTEQNGNLPD